MRLWPYQWSLNPATRSSSRTRPWMECSVGDWSRGKMAKVSGWKPLLVVSDFNDHYKNIPCELFQPDIYPALHGPQNVSATGKTKRVWLCLQAHPKCGNGNKSASSCKKQNKIASPNAALGKSNVVLLEFFFLFGLFLNTLSIFTWRMRRWMMF